MIALSLFCAAFLVWAGVTVFFWKAGAWLPYYVIGSAGSAILMVVGARDFLPLEFALRASTAYAVDGLSHLTGVGTRVTWSDPGSILVVGVPHHNEWTQLRVGLESSGLLESAALAGLVAFFPNGRLLHRAMVVALGLLASFVANAIRVLLIVTSVGYLGQGTLDVAHVFVGRALFFLIACVIYWFAITRPTLRTVHCRLRGGPI